MECEICHKKLKYVTKAHLAKHNMTSKQYRQVFPNAETYHWSEERRKSASERTKGVGNPMYGKHRHHSAESRKKMSESGKGRPKAQQHRDRMSIGKRKLWGAMTDEEKKKRMAPMRSPQALENLRKKLKTRSYAWVRGKKYSEIFGSEQKAKERAKITSNWMKTEKNIRRFNKRVSRGQRKLFEAIKKYKPTAILDHPIKAEGRTFWLDVAIPEAKKDIEYDGKYWHTLNHSQGCITDSQRDEILSRAGWSITRISELDSEEIVMGKLVEGGIIC